MSKRKHHTLVSKPLASRTFQLVDALLLDGSLDAKRQYRNLKASHKKKVKQVVSMGKVAGFWNPDGKRQARGSGVKCATINKVWKDKQ
jgi:hypothetical protein